MRPRQEHHRAPNPVPRATHLPNRERGGDLRHILDTALPPGIGEGDAIDPGANTPTQPSEPDERG